MRSKNRKGVESKKTGKTSTIELSIENIGKLHNTASNLEKIFHKRHVTPDQVISCFYELHPFDKMIGESL